MAANDAVTVKSGLTVEGDMMFGTPVALLRGVGGEGNGFYLRLNSEQMATIQAKLEEQENEAKALENEAEDEDDT